MWRPAFLHRGDGVLEGRTPGCWRSPEFRLPAAASPRSSAGVKVFHTRLVPGRHRRRTRTGHGFNSRILVARSDGRSGRRRLVRRRATGSLQFRHFVAQAANIGDAHRKTYGEKMLFHETPKWQSRTLNDSHQGGCSVGAVWPVGGRQGRPTWRDHADFADEGGVTATGGSARTGGLYQEESSCAVWFWPWFPCVRWHA